jgi:hypothetical protein
MYTKQAITREKIAEMAHINVVFFFFSGDNGILFTVILPCQHELVVFNNWFVLKMANPDRGDQCQDQQTNGKQA